MTTRGVGVDRTLGEGCLGVDRVVNGDQFLITAKKDMLVSKRILANWTKTYFWPMPKQVPD